MKRVVPVAVGLAIGVAVGFFLGAMVTRHDESIGVIYNGTDETLRGATIAAYFPKSSGGYLPEVAAYSIDKLQPHHTYTVRLSSHRPTELNVHATTAGGKQLSSEKVYVESQGVVFALVSSDGITLQYEKLSNRADWH